MKIYAPCIRAPIPTCHRCHHKYCPLQRLYFDGRTDEHGIQVRVLLKSDTGSSNPRQWQYMKDRSRPSRLF